ncbi:MAG: superoxide dismutase [Ni] [Acidobacteriota bacterium]
MTRSSLRWTAFAVALAVALLAAPSVLAHCQVPCGIYGDETRFVIMEEDVTTIEKSMKEIIRLSAEETPNWNQLVRWVENKEDHADKLTEVVTYYFMAQRIKPPATSVGDEYKKYVHELSILHRMMVHAMKAKQTTDLAEVAKLRELIAALKTSYLGEQGHSH